MLTQNTRWMIRRDLKQVLELADSMLKDPWSEEEIIKFLRQRNSIGMVIEEIDTGVLENRDEITIEPITGFMLYELHKTYLHVHYWAAATKDDIEVLSHKLVSKLSSKRREKVIIDVPCRDLGAQMKLSEIGWFAIYEKDDFIRFEFYY